MQAKNSSNIDFKKYIFFYKNAQYLGASHLLNKFISNSDEVIIPASVSHGVDFYHSHFLQDMDAIEPLHWACRKDFVKVKPTFIAPHPWTINLSLSNYSNSSKSSLLIGPPPSIDNDANLLSILKKKSIVDFDILIKPKGDFKSSIEFWNKHGFSTRTAGIADKNFYSRLAQILSEYHNIICPTISSALFFSASMGKKIITIPEYSYKVYENMNYLDEVDTESLKARDIVKIIINGNLVEISELSQFLLGFDYLGEASAIKKEILELSASLIHPFNIYKNNVIPYWIREFLTLSLKKQKIMRFSPQDYFDLFSKGHVGVMTMAEFDLRLNGKNKNNFNLERVKFIPEKTEPGYGYPQYSQL